MGFMGIAVKVLIGLVLLLPMTAYVTWSLVAAADPPPKHTPIIVHEQTKAPAKPSHSPSAKPTEKRTDHHGKNSGRGGSDDNGPKVIQPSPSVMDDDGDVFDDHGGLDNSGKGSGGGDDNSSGKGSGDD